MAIKDNDYNEVLLNAIKAKLPPSISPMWFIMETLSVGKDAAYRRLRGEVPLILQEAVLLSKALDISLHELVDTIDDKLHFSISLMDFEAPDETTYNILQAYQNSIDQAGDDPLSELNITANIFPLQLFLHNEILTNFALFKWLYLSGMRQAKTYHEIHITDRMQLLLSNLQEANMQFSTTCYIFDRQLSRSLMNDLKYFTAVGLLSREDAESIREEARELLNQLEQLAITGRYENGNAVHIYVSDIYFNKSYHNIKAGEYHAGIIEVCVFNGLVSTGKNCYQRMNEWFEARRSLSTLITKSGEPQRIAFFKEQHRQLDEL